MHFKTYVSIFFLILISFSCKKKVKLSFDDTPEIDGVKEWVETATPADTVVPVFEFLKAKFRGFANMNGSTQNFNANMRWQKGEKIWISMSLFGIEGVRALIDSGGVRWIDRLNGEYHILPMNKIASKINMELDFPAIERLMLGLPAILDTLPTEITTSEEWIQWKTFHRNGFESSAVFNRINSMLIEYRAENYTQLRTLSAKYGDIRKVNDGLFPFERQIKISENTLFFELQSKFSEVDILSELAFPFDVPEKYKVIEY